MTPDVVRLAAACAAVFFATVVSGLGLVRCRATSADCVSQEDGSGLQFAAGRAASESADGFLPPGWNAFQDPHKSSRGWEWSGIVQLPLDDAAVEVDDAMKRCGYAVKLRIPGGDGGSLLVQYENGEGEHVLWSLSRGKGGKTLFSCGKE